jgi:hypothetical protein
MSSWVLNHAFESRSAFGGGSTRTLERIERVAPNAK